MNLPSNGNSNFQLKLTIVGNAVCGKSSPVVTYALGKFTEDFVPTVYDPHIEDINVNGKRVELSVWDTADQQYSACVRRLTYPNSHVVLICFAIDSPGSLQNVQETWIEEVTHYCPGAPIILLGCKVDLRKDPASINVLSKLGRAHVTEEEGLAVARKIGAAHYMETSSKERIGLYEVFECAAREGLRYRPPERQ
ncbi:hypothetical protein K443DRAFT_133647 [Laccaria amethystina LaAM-08-1]|uniref:Uncharacterized protein n=1 Tax=Laccaria amethystina LaAM-08-1 TaxID=1095629 RepID=A0A0C9XK78_9AGAR|nr:hypothetical protein K443DRAFT_133647 [Laccaria amethystina LaAM-08-1]